MTIVAGDVLRTTMNFTLADGTEYQNVYHHQRTGVGILSDAQHVTAIDAWMTTTYSRLNALIDTGVVSDLCSVDKVEWTGTFWEVVENIGTFVHTTSFTGAASDMVPQVSPFVTFKTSRPKSVGRKFLFPFTENEYVDGLLVAAATTAMAQYATDVIANIVVIALNDLVPGIPRAAVDVFLPFFVGIVTNVPGTQRRRRFGVGA